MNLIDRYGDAIWKTTEIIKIHCRRKSIILKQKT